MDEKIKVSLPLSTLNILKKDCVDFLIVKESGRKKVDFNYVKADRYNISVVKKAQFFTMFVPVTILFCVLYFL